MNYSWSKSEPFFIEYGSHYIHGDLLPSDAKKHPQVLFLQGEHSTGREEFTLLRQVLLHHYDIASCAFDFLGYGSSLCIDGASSKHLAFDMLDRIAQTSDIINACFDLQALSIIAVDASANIALQLCEDFRIQNLIVVNPAGDYQASPETSTHLTEIHCPLALLNSKPELISKIARTINNTLIKSS